MYEPPVQISEAVERICEEITKAKDEYIFSQIRAVVDVDREEIIKALQYDRQQYEKGYSDGVAARDAEIVRCKECKYKEGSCCDYSAVYVRPNGYCQWGERRE